MVTAVPPLVWFFVVGTGVFLIALLTLAVRNSEGTTGSRAAIIVGAVLSIWYGLVVVISLGGHLAGSTNAPPRIGPALGIPLVLGLLVLGLSSHVRDLFARIPQRWLVGMQTVRVIGVVFLVLLARGLLPAHFALPAGLGDIAVGVAAPFVARAVAHRARGADAAVLVWNAVGLLDLISAITLGSLTAQSSIRVFFTTPSTEAMTALPMSLIPAFGVPIFILLHVVSLIALRRSYSRRVVERRPTALSRTASHA